MDLVPFTNIDQDKLGRKEGSADQRLYASSFPSTMFPLQELDADNQVAASSGWRFTYQLAYLSPTQTGMAEAKIDKHPDSRFRMCQAADRGPSSIDRVSSFEAPVQAPKVAGLSITASNS